MFEYVDALSRRTCLAKAYNAVCVMGAWDFIAENNVEKYFWCTGTLFDGIKEECSCIDSSRLLWTMRQMRYIALHGENQFKNMCLKNRQKSHCLNKFN
jgi:hypothetical protein